MYVEESKEWENNEILERRKERKGEDTLYQCTVSLSKGNCCYLIRTMKLS